MWQRFRGNPLFVRHLVEGAVEAGLLRQVCGVWQLRGRTAVSAQLASLVRRANGVAARRGGTCVWAAGIL